MRQSRDGNKRAEGGKRMRDIFRVLKFCFILRARFSGVYLYGISAIIIGTHTDRLHLGRDLDDHGSDRKAP